MNHTVETDFFPGTLVKRHRVVRHNPHDDATLETVVYTTASLTEANAQAQYRNNMQ